MSKRKMFKKKKIGESSSTLSVLVQDNGVGCNEF